jgi:hypothetical protein
MEQRRFWTNKRESEKLFQLENYKSIMKELNIKNSNNIAVLDKQESLVLLHYINPRSDSHIRGVIYDTLSQRAVCRSFPYTEEVEDINEMENRFSRNLTITKAYEGTILRLFNFNGVWYLSTHKKINGRRSRWSGREFGQLFDETYTGNFENLNKSLVYIFLLSHPENRIVINVENPTLYLTGIYNGKELLHPSQVDEATDSSLIVNEKLQFDTFEELKVWFENLDSDTVSGVLIYDKESYIKVTLSEYTRKKFIRGNNPNLNIRFVELYKVGKERELETLFPNNEFSKLRDSLESVLTKLETLYDKRYVQREFCRLDYPWARILDKIYYNYEENKSIREQILEKSFAKQLYDLLEE